MELNQALKIADGLVKRLAPHCDKIEVAGSCRREQPQVKDIEIVALPKVKVNLDVFGNPTIVVRKKGFADEVNEHDKILKGSLEKGRYVQLQLKQGINVDLFLPAAEDYYRQLAIRTGSADYSKNVLALGWVKLGWVGSDLGLRRQRDCVKRGKEWKCINPDGKRPPVWQSEKEFFDWLNVKWVEPRLRR